MKNFILKFIWTILRAEAKLVLLIKKPLIVAVIGSIAKTTTKDSIYWVLKDDYKVWKTPGNLNAEIGIPLTVLGYKKDKSPNKFLLPYYLLWGLVKSLVLLILPYPKVLILEMGIEHKGDIRYFSKLAKPNIAVVTAIGPVHLELFKDLNGVYDEKADIARVLTNNDWLVLNQSDENVKKMAAETKAKVKYFQSETIDISKNASRAVAELFDLNADNVEQKLDQFKMPKQRMNIIKIKDITIVDDSYNSNPLATEASLNNFAKMKGRQKVAVLGDMLELGEYEEEGHRKIGELAGKICDIVIFVGNNAELFAKGAINNLSSEKIIKVSDAKLASQKILNIVRPGDIILIKGSRRIGLEEVVRTLKSK